MNTVSIRKITGKNELSVIKDEVSNMLSRAFHQDPNYCYMMPNDRKRLEQNRWWMKIMLSYGVLFGEVYVTEANDGAVIWLGPKSPYVDSFRICRLGLALYPFIIGLSNFLRMLKVMGIWEQLHKREAVNHMYLMVIGVEPGRQGKGMGSALLEPVLSRADRDKLPCYLETATSEDVRFYEKNGFKVVKHDKVKKGPEFWTMRREPA
jgi:GNAT superfamily N-acetyltransferase